MLNNLRIMFVFSFFLGLMNAQSSIECSVTDSNGGPLAGANVVVDGTSVAVNTFSGTFTGTFANSMIGQNTLNGNYLHGKVAHIGLFSAVKAIGDVFVAGREPVDLTNLSNLVAYYKFDEGSGTVAFDGSSRNNNATLVNTPTWSSQVPIV